MNHEGFIKIKGLIDSMTFNPSLLNIFFDGIDLIPYSRLPLPKGYRFINSTISSEVGNRLGLKFDSVMRIGFRNPESSRG